MTLKPQNGPYNNIDDLVDHYLLEILNKLPIEHSSSGLISNKIKSGEIQREIVEYLLQKNRAHIGMKTKNGEIIKINGKPLKFTKFDLKKLPEYSDDELKIIILADTGIDLFSRPEYGLQQINLLFKIANNEETLGFLPEILKRKKIFLLPNNFQIHSLKELFDFMRSAGPESSESKIKCIMMKIVSGVADTMRAPGLSNLQEKLEQLLKDLTLVLGLRNVGDVTLGKSGNVGIEIFGRPKSLNSILLKTLGDSEYDRASETKDGVGLTFEINGGGKQEYLNLFRDVLNGCLSLGGELIEIKSKGISQNEVIGFIHENKDLNGINGIYDNIKEERKTGTNKGYIDLKFIIQFGHTKTEIKIIPHENQNQEGLNNQGIYAMLNRYIEGFIIRHLNDGYITEEELKMIAEVFFINLQKILNENPEITGISKEEFLFGIQKEGFMGLWEDMQKKGLIRGDVKPKKNLETTINSYFIPGLIQYFKQKLVGVKLKNGNIVWRNQRSKAIYES